MRLLALAVLLVTSAAVAFTIALAGSVRALGLFRVAERLPARPPRR